MSQAPLFLQLVPPAPVTELSLVRRSVNLRHWEFEQHQVTGTVGSGGDRPFNGLNLNADVELVAEEKAAAVERRAQRQAVRLPVHPESRPSSEPEDRLPLEFLPRPV
jgi:hypothetical protein